MSGFNAFEQTGIVLNVGDTRSVNMTLKIGAVTETISVTADASLVQTQTLSVGQVTLAGTDRRSAAERPQRHAAARAGGRRGR